MITPNSTESTRINSLWQALHEKDEFWVNVKTEPCFSRYTDFGDTHDQTAYSLYSDGRDMAISMRGALSDVHDPHAVTSYSDYISQLEIFLKEFGPYYRKRHEFHKTYVAKKEAAGAPIGFSVKSALRLWGEQVKLLDGFQVLVNLLKESETYKKEIQMKDTPVSNNFTFNNQANVQVGNHNSQSIVQGLNDMISQINSSAASPEAKAEAKSKLRSFLENPVVAAVIGASVGGLFQSLK